MPSDRRDFRRGSEPPRAAALVCHCLCLSIAIWSAAAAADQSRVPWPFYHTADEMLRRLRAAASTHGHLLRLSDERDPDGPETLPMVTITDFATGEDGKEVIMLVFGEHARELITSEISLWLARLLIGDAEALLQWPSMQQMLRSGIDGVAGSDVEQWRARLLRRTVFKMLPIVNLEGRRQVERGDFCLRTKLNRVDLNRNYPVGFRKMAPTSMDFGGGFPFSEPETRIIRAHATADGPRKPGAFVSVHSGEWALYIPWDSRMTRGEDLPGDTEELLGRMNVHCRCMNGPAGQVAGYLAFGSGMDYMYSVARIPYPLTVEVYGPNGLGTFAAGGHPRRRGLLQYGLSSKLRGGTPNLGCLKEFNPHTEPLYQDTVAKWIGSFLNMADFLAKRNDTSGQPQASKPQVVALPAAEHRGAPGVDSASAAAFRPQQGSQPQQAPAVVPGAEAAPNDARMRAGEALPVSAAGRKFGHPEQHSHGSLFFSASSSSSQLLAFVLLAGLLLIALTAILRRQLASSQKARTV